jgi:hypothetical protein
MTGARHDAPIAIAGAGPVGSCLAIEAALRGIDVVIVEPRAADEPPSAKCNTVAARTMETFRRFGIAEKVRAAGLPDDYPTDVIYTSSVAGPEIVRIAQPSRAERHLQGYPDSHWATPEPVVRISQIFLEPEGLNFGYFYEGSPIICGDGSEAPPYTMGAITPSTVPGCRMPHFAVDGKPILDLLGPDYTLVRFDLDLDLDVSAFLDRANAAGLPVTVVEAGDPPDPEVFVDPLLIVRPDQHVAWRGDHLDAEIVDRLRGVAP